MKARIMKPCIVFVLGMLHKHAPGAGTIDLHFTPHWLCQNFTSKVCISISLIARIMKPCIVIIREILYKHAPWPGTLDLHFTLHWLWQNFTSSIYYSVFLCTHDIYDYGTLHCKCFSHSLQARILTCYPWPIFRAPLTCQNFTKVGFSLPMIARSMNYCIQIVIDILKKHAPWSGTLDIHLMLHWLCQYITFTFKRD